MSVRNKRCCVTPSSNTYRLHSLCTAEAQEPHYQHQHAPRVLQTRAAPVPPTPWLVQSLPSPTGGASPHTDPMRSALGKRQCHPQGGPSAAPPAGLGSAQGPEPVPTPGPLCKPAPGEHICSEV